MGIISSQHNKLSNSLMQDPIQNPLIQKIKTHLETLKPVQDLLDNNKYTPALTDKEKEAEQAELDGFATNQDRHYEHDTDKSEIRRKYTKINVERNIAKSTNIDSIQKLLEETKTAIDSLLLEIDAELNKELSMSDKIKGSLLSKSYNGEGNGIKSKIFKELNSYNSQLKTILADIDFQLEIYKAPNAEANYVVDSTYIDAKLVPDNNEKALPVATQVAGGKKTRRQKSQRQKSQRQKTRRQKTRRHH